MRTAPDGERPCQRAGNFPGCGGESLLWDSMLCPPSRANERLLYPNLGKDPAQSGENRLHHGSRAGILGKQADPVRDPGREGGEPLAQDEPKAKGPQKQLPMNTAHPALRLIVVEDQQLFLELIVGLCERDFGFKVVATAGTGAQALETTRKTEHDVVLLDLNLPDMDGIDVATRLMADDRVRHIVALSSQIDDYTLHRVVASGIQGYVDKNLQSSGVLRTAIEIVAAGGVFFTPVVQEVRRELGRDPDAFSKVLSEREQELLSMLGRGLNDSEAATKLGVKPQTIHSHRRNILRKLNLSGTKQLVRYALEHGFVRQPTHRRP